MELKDGLKYLNDMLETSENDEEKKLLEDIKNELGKKKVEDLTDEERQTYLQEWKEEVSKLTDKEKAEKEKLEAEEKKKLEEAEKKKLKEQEAEKKRLEEEAKKKEMALDEKIKSLEDKFEKQEVEKKTLEDKVKDLTDKDVKLTRKLHETEVEATIKALQAKGIYPAQLEIAKAIMLADSDTVKFFEEVGDEKKEISVSINEAVVRMLDAIPKDARIDLEEKARSTAEEKGKKVTIKEAEVMIKKYEDEHGVSHEDATSAVMSDLEKKGQYPYE